MNKEMTDLHEMKMGNYKLVNGGEEDYFRVRIILDTSTTTEDRKGENNDN